MTEKDYYELWPCKHQLVQSVPLLKLIRASLCRWFVKAVFWISGLP